MHKVFLFQECAHFTQRHTLCIGPCFTKLTERNLFFIMACVPFILISVKRVWLYGISDIDILNGIDLHPFPPSFYFSDTENDYGLKDM